MRPRLTDIPAPGPGPVALFVLAASGALAWLIRIGRIELVSLPSIEIVLMLLFVAWVGVVRPLRASRRQQQGRKNGSLRSP